MKIKNKNKNDRVAFFNCSNYKEMSKKERQTFRLPEVPLGTLEDFMAMHKHFTQNLS